MATKRNESYRNEYREGDETLDYENRSSDYEQNDRMLRGRRQIKSINFEEYASEGNRFINDVAYELDIDRNRAARLTRAVLHAVRDRIPPNDAIEFAQGLPMALKGIFIDQYDLSKAPVVIRDPDAFIDYIYSKNGNASEWDFPTRRHVVSALRGVFRVLERNMDYGQVNQIKQMFNSEIAEYLK